MKHGGDAGHREEIELMFCRWAAPELLRNEQYDGKVDIFRYGRREREVGGRREGNRQCSFGTVIWEIVTELLPFDDVDWDSQVHQAVVDGKRPGSIEDFPNADLRRPLDLCWRQNPAERVSFEELVGMLDEAAERAASVVQEEQECIVTEVGAVEVDMDADDL